MIEINGYPVKVKCSLCSREAEHKHHLYGQSKEAKSKYKKLIHHPSNIIYLCHICHLNKPIPTISEQEFCYKLGLKYVAKSKGDIF